MKIRTNHKALISLIIMLIGFLITLFSRNTAIMILQSGFEAGLVGGLADWFAVSALFRYPFGIKVPHTALLPNNRARITKALVSIVENNLLNKSSIVSKINELHVIKRFLNICRNSIYSKEVRLRIIDIIKNVISYIPIEKVSVCLLNLMQRYLNTLESKKILEELTSICLKNNYELKILDNLIDKCDELVKKKEIQTKFGEVIFNSTKKLKVNIVKQYTINTIVNIVGRDKIGSIVQDLIIKVLSDLRIKDNSSRIMILQLIQNNIRNISSNQNIIQKVEEYKSNLTNNTELNDFIVKALNEGKSKILSYAADDDYIEENILPSLDNLICKILDNVQLIDKLEQYIKEQVSDYIDNNHEKIGKLVKENIDKLETETLIELIEDRIGDDLQWIRINGAICGFLIGLILGIIRILSA